MLSEFLRVVLLNRASLYHILAQLVLFLDCTGAVYAATSLVNSTFKEVIVLSCTQTSISDYTQLSSCVTVLCRVTLSWDFSGNVQRTVAFF